ncbi:DEAD/DEAH box helicase [Alicyclobacillus vulcanalis]|uniref:Helicase conserved C-terminal domain-containing protein n=1 Tax=Alicyclobacillus vulcanalis TaxID=252246 RepID=A0A1N7KPR1_9BACL|nr:SNF2-related protein [Alicyclobacillus vulcanalis]SIS63410.1 Helicase conserved C-terminal domain-containing protein [Alicyclobacillus vulcanalis]
MREVANVTLSAQHRPWSFSFGGLDVETEFEALLHTGRGSRDADWELFRLAAIARQAWMAPAFDQLLALEHVQFTPLPHQVETALRVVRDLRGRAILADEVGLGKTIEAGLVLKEYLVRGLVQKALVLVPASLVSQWTRELTQKFRISATPQRDEWTWTTEGVIVSSLDTAKRPPHADRIREQWWDLIIVDEAHKLKNPNTKNFQFLNQLQHKYMLFLTATPIQNQLKELHTLVTLLKPGELGNSAEFSERFVASPRKPKDPAGLRQTVSRVMIRNRREDGALELPKRHVQTLPVELTPDERAFYEAVQAFLRSEFERSRLAHTSILPLITLQREICSSAYAALLSLEKMMKKTRDPDRARRLSALIDQGAAIGRYAKVETVLRMLENAPDKVIIFTEYRASQDFLMYTLKKHGISAVPFRGGFRRGKKDWMRELFSKKIRVLVATESGGEGINLQFCNYMINYDLPWNPMRLEQRIGRIHRLGQTQPCHIVHLVTQNTIEEHIMRVLQDKIRMFEAVIGRVDEIVADVRFDRWEKLIFEAAMTSRDDEEFVNHLRSIQLDDLVARKGGTR